MKIVISIVFIFTFACTHQPLKRKQIEQVISENPEILFDVIKQNPEKFMIILESTLKQAQLIKQKKTKKDQEHQLEKAFENPYRPVISDESILKGDKNAPITIVEYSDFECPYCQRSYRTMEKILKKYPGKIKFVYKHLPLSFHPQAMISAKYFEAIKKQSKKKAVIFHDNVFKNQPKLKKGETFLLKIAKQLKVDINKLQRDLKSKEIEQKIQADIAEAQKFDIKGTPGFLINGIPLKGAYPIEEFDKIIERIL
jgi:protein-disulfide isomerase